MSNYLRVTRDDYQAIRSACALHDFGRSSGRFQRFLAETLRPSHAALAAWVDGLSRKQARIIRLHVVGRRSDRDRDPPGGFTDREIGRGAAEMR